MPYTLRYCAVYEPSRDDLLEGPDPVPEYATERGDGTTTITTTTRASDAQLVPILFELYERRLEALFAGALGASVSVQRVDFGAGGTANLPRGNPHHPVVYLTWRPTRGAALEAARTRLGEDFATRTASVARGIIDEMAANPTLFRADEVSMERQALGRLRDHGGFAYIPSSFPRGQSDDWWIPACPTVFSNFYVGGSTSEVGSLGAPVRHMNFQNWLANVMPGLQGGQASPVEAMARDLVGNLSADQRSVLEHEHFRVRDWVLRSALFMANATMHEVGHCLLEHLRSDPPDMHGTSGVSILAARVNHQSMPTAPDNTTLQPLLQQSRVPFYFAGMPIADQMFRLQNGGAYFAAPPTVAAAPPAANGSGGAVDGLDDLGSLDGLGL